MRLPTTALTATRRVWVGSVVAIALLASSGVERALAQDDPGAAAARLRALYFLRDYERGVMEGRELSEAPQAFEARAWYVLNLARFRKVEDAVAEAEAMVEADSANPFGWFALAGALNWHDERGEEALGASKKALGLSPDALDFIWLRAEVLRKQDGNEAAIAYIDELPADIQRHPDVLARKGVALHYLWNDQDEETRGEDECHAVFEEARRLDPQHVEAHYLAGAYLFSAGKREEGSALIKRAAELTPSIEVHQRYWRLVTQSREATREEKRAEIEEDIAWLLERRGDSPGTLQAISSIYGQLKLEEKQREMEERVLAEYPETEAAEWVLVNRYRKVRTELYEEKRETGTEDPARREELRRMLVAFIERPQHARERLLGDAYRELFRIIRDEPDVDPEYLYEVVDGMVRYEGINVHITHGQGVIVLAEHKTHFRDAERLAREGLVKAREVIEDQHERGVYDTEEDYQKGLGWYTGIMYDALGWVFFNEGRLDEAEEQLLEAFELHKENKDNLYHLGKLHEVLSDEASAGGDEEAVQRHLDRAEEFYIKGVMVQSFGDNPSDEALKALYARRRGTEEGYEEYLARAEDIDRERRLARILDERIAEPEAISPFSLTALDGSTVSYETMTGKVVVINFWGVWCGPCVIEMPELQKFYEQYKADPDVIVLTIDTGDDPDEVREWIAEHEYTFPVLLDDGYVDEVDVNAFPTTWFIDREGRIVFQKRGASEKLAEEFGWRVEALRKSS